MTIEEVNNEEEEDDFFDIAGDVLAAPFRGVEGAVQGAYNLVDYLAFDVLPDYDTRFLGTSKTMAGGAVEGIAQFATGFVPLFGLAGRVGTLAKAGTVTKGVVAGAATDFTFFNGQEARLSNLIQQVPELQNPVTEFLAYDADEGELEGRMKNVLEGLGLEAVAGVFIKSLKAMKKARKAKEEGVTAEQQAQLINDELEGGAAFADLPDFRDIETEPSYLELQGIFNLSEKEAVDLADKGFNHVGRLVDERIETLQKSIEVQESIVKGETPDLPEGWELVDGTFRKKTGIKGLDDYLEEIKQEEIGLDQETALSTIKKLKSDLKRTQDYRDVIIRTDLKKGITEPELQQKLDELGETVTDIDEAIDRRPGPFKTYEEEAMMDIIPKGAGNLKSRLMKKFPIKGADPEDVADVEKFIDVMGQRMFGDVSLSVTNKIPSAGRYNFGNNLLQIRQATIDKGEIKRTMVHELWHSLSRYLPSTDVDSLTKQFQKERQNYLDDLGKRAKDKAKTPSERIALAKELNGFKKGEFTSDNYRYADVDEYFAEEMTDAFLKKLDEKDLAPQGTLKRIAQEVAILFKDMFASLKAKLGIDQRQKIFNDFLKQRNIKIQRQRPLEFGRTFAEMPDFKKGADEILQAVPEKFRGYMDSLLKGGKPRLPQFALETGEDTVVLKDLLEEFYKENPDKITVQDTIKEVDDAINQAAMLQQGKDAETKLLEARRTQQTFRDQGVAIIDNLIENVKEYGDTGGGEVVFTKLKNNFQQLLNVADIYRRIGRETAITLASRREGFSARKIGLNPADLEIEGLRKQFLDASGGMHPDKLYRLIKESIDESDPDAMLTRMFKVAKQAQGKHWLDMPTEYWMNAILSGPRTQAVNVLGNSLTQVLSTLEAVLGGVLTGNMSVVKAVLGSWADSQMWREASKFAGKAFKQGDNLLDPQARAFSDRPQGAITGERIAEGKFGKYVNERGIRSKESINAFGNFIRIPSRLLLTTDEFFKQLSYRRAARLKAAVEVVQQGVKDPKAIARHVHDKVEGIITEGGRVASEAGLAREADALASKQGLKGVKKDDFIRKYIEDNFNPESSALIQYAMDEAQYLTFTRELQDKTLGKVLQEATNKLPALRLVLPFVRTPTNILKFAFERTPGVFTPLMKEQRDRLINDIFKSNDPVLRSQAMGKLATSTIVAGTIIDTIYNNREYITGGGPSDPRQKESLMATGWRPYSIKIGDTYYSYQRLDPVATLIGVGADIVELGVKEEKAFDESSVEHGTKALMIALTRNVTNKSYLAGIQMWTDALSDPDRYMARFGRNFLSSFVPNVMAQMADYDTQAYKEVRSVQDALLRKVGARGSLDSKRNLLGEEYKVEQWMGTGFINPVAMSPIKNDPVLTEMSELNHAFRQASPNLGGQIDLLEYENEKGQSAHDRRLELLQTVRIKGRTLRKSLERLIKSSAYQRLEKQSEPGLPSPRIKEITSLLTKYKQEALKQTLREFPQLNAQYANLVRAKSQLKEGVSREDVLELLTQ